MAGVASQSWCEYSLTSARALQLRGEDGALEDVAVLSYRTRTVDFSLCMAPGSSVGRQTVGCLNGRS